MSCDNCMKHRPDRENEGNFMCPECGQVYVLAGVGPGNYWVRIEDKIIEGLKYSIPTEDEIRRIAELKALRRKKIEEFQRKMNSKTEESTENG